MTAPSFWGRFFGGLFGTKRLNKDSKSETHRGSTTASGNPVNAETALRLAAVWACVRLRSQTVASLPLHLYKDDKTVAKDHYLYRILHDAPNADMTASEFWEAMSAALDLWGNAYAYIVRNSRNGQVVSLEVLNPEHVTVWRNKDGVVVYLYREGRNVYNYADADILHIKGFTLDGFVGLSPIQYQASVMGFQIDANTAANQEFKNGLKAGGFLKTGENKLNDQQRDRLRANLEEFGKPENAGKFMVLEAGMEVVSTGNVRISPQDAQLLQSRYFGIEEICRTFATPPQMIYHTDKASSWASSLEGMKLGYLQFSLRPNLVRIEQQIVKKLLTPAERLKFKPKFSVEGLLRADSQGRATFYTSALQNGWMSRNEVRELEELPPVEGADSLTVQLNLTPIEMLQAVANQKQDRQMAIKTKDFMNFKAETVSEDGFFSGYCNVFDVEDSYGDVVRKGAFVDSLNEWQAKGKLPPILWQHDKATVLGVWTKLFEDEKGLYGEGQLLINDVAKAKEAHALLKHGAIDGLSIGYYVKEYSIDNEQGVYNLLKLDLREISIVTFPANTDSRIDAVKSHLAKGELPSLSDFEKFLREAGFSKSQATAIAGHGLRSLLQGEPDSKISSEKSSGDTAEILSILQSI